MQWKPYRNDLQPIVKQSFHFIIFENFSLFLPKTRIWVKDIRKPAIIMSPWAPWWVLFIIYCSLLFQSAKKKEINPLSKSILREFPGRDVQDPKKLSQRCTGFNGAWVSLRSEEYRCVRDIRFQRPCWRCSQASDIQFCYVLTCRGAEKETPLVFLSHQCFSNGYEWG